MTSQFINYYNLVREHANDILDNLYDDLISDLKEYSHGYSSFNFFSQNDTYISEYNNYMNISLRDAIEILEQSTRLCEDEGLYMRAGDCREQVKSMAYWTYRNDLIAELRGVLKERLENAMSNFEFVANEFQNELDSLEEKVEEIEEQIDELKEELEMATEEEKTKTVKALQEQINNREIEVESYRNEIEKLEDELSSQHNLLQNSEKIIGEIY